MMAISSFAIGAFSSTGTVVFCLDSASACTATDAFDMAGAMGFRPSSTCIWPAKSSK